MKTNLILLFIFISINISLAQEKKATEFKALVNLNVSNLEDEPIANETVIFISEKDQQEYLATTNDSGRVQILLPKGKKYDVKYRDLIEKVKYSSFEVPGGMGKYSFDITIKFEPSDVVELKGILFTEGGVIDEMSTIELDMMKEVLELNPKMEIMVTSHSDNSLDKSESLKKTQAQADLIKAYFIKNGIEKDRIKSKGMGDMEPLYSNALPEGRLKNNRIEIRVIKKYL